MFDANLTLNQLTQSNNGTGRLSVMIGAKNFAMSSEEKFVSFRFHGTNTKNKANYLKITLNAADTYDVEFGYIRGMNYTTRSKHDGMYCDMLKELFENETGLYLSL